MSTTLNGKGFNNISIRLYELVANKIAQALKGVRGCIFSNGNHSIYLRGGDYQQANGKYNAFTNLTWIRLSATVGKVFTAILSATATRRA